MQRPNLIDGLGPIKGMEGPFQYPSGAVLYYNPIEGKFYSRGSDMYLETDEAERLTKQHTT